MGGGGTVGLTVRRKEGDICAIEGRGGQKSGCDWIAISMATEKRRVKEGHAGEDKTGLKEETGEEVEARTRWTQSAHG